MEFNIFYQSNIVVVKKNIRLTIFRDRIKNKYCEDHKINLLLIRYDQIDKIDNMITSAIESIKKTKKYIFVCDHELEKPKKIMISTDHDDKKY